MGEINTIKTLSCLICDSIIENDESFSVFCTFIANSGKLLANSVEKNLSLKDLGSLSLRSNVLCLKCFGCFEELTDCENKIVKLKGDLWTVFKETCEKHGEDVETHIKGISTQTDIRVPECDCKLKKSQSSTDLKLEPCYEDRDNKDFEEERLSGNEENLKFEGDKLSEEITVDVDPPFNDDDSSKWKRRPESCKLCGKWFKKVVELDNHMLVHAETEKSDKSVKEEGEIKTRKKFHSCSICNKKFRRPCEVKEHMVSHKSTTPFVCKYCGKKLKSKTGAIYHTLKAHKIDIAKNKKLDEHFHLDVIDAKEENKVESENEDYEFRDEANEEPEDKIVIQVDDGSSSEDEVPLARRRKEFIFEKIKQEVRSEKPDTPERKQRSVQKQALQQLKKWCDVSVTKVSKNSEEGSRRKLVSSPKVKEEGDLSSVVEKIDSEEIRSKITGLSKANEVTIQSKSEVLTSEGDDDASSDFIGNSTQNEKPRGRTRKYPLSALLKLKRQKDAGLFPPPMKEPKFKCDICGKMWKTRGELNAHKITHSDARPYICEICGQAYKHKPALDVHVGMHKGIYHHQCPYCQKAFTQKGALQRHLPIHTGDLPYQCELCGKRFVHRTSFSIHTMAHTGVRNIRCKVCNLGVLSKSHLRRHMRIHTGEKPYDCQTCGKAFAERYNLVAHQRIHDPNLVGPARQQKKKMQTCRLCNATFDRRHKLEDHMVTVHNKVVDDAPRPSIFDTGEGYTAPRLMVDRYEVRKPQGNEREEQDDKSNVGSDSNPNDLSVRNFQSIHIQRNLELFRNLETSRNFELIRMANGISGMDDTLRIPGTGGGAPWTYVNPGS